MQRPLIGGPLAVLVLATSLAAQKPPAFVGAVQMPEGWKPCATETADVDGDGRLDLVIASLRRANETERRLGIHLRRDQGFSPTADFEVELQPDVTAFALGDFSGDPGLEVALFGGNLVAIWRPREKGAARFRDRFPARFLYQVPRNGVVVVGNDWVEDLDGDGLVDLLLPEPGGFRCALQRRDQEGLTQWQAERHFSLPAQRLPRSDAEREHLARERKSARLLDRVPEFEEARSGQAARAPLVEILDETARPWIVDFDGDGKLDVVARGAFEVFVWSDVARRAGGDPDLRFEAPVVADRSRATDIAYGSHFRRLDGDRLCDAVVFASDHRADEPRTQVLIYHQDAQRNGAASPLFGDKGLPAQLLVLAGFTGGAHFKDVDGDGQVDLALGVLRPDVIDGLRGQLKDVADVDLYLFRNEGDSFSRNPDLKRSIEIEVKGLSSLTHGLQARFTDDYSGDGTAELVVRDREERLRVYWTRKDRRTGALSIFDQPLWEFAIDEDADLMTFSATKTEGAGIVVIEPGQVLMLRFKE
ncbi:MAG: hypothetical protein H6807_09090 [Planctomycetes bacterium]|nr:hypothetical protein [Planctomycetota bacterium]